MSLEKIVHGALCKCKYGTVPDQLQVLTQNKWFANDKNATKKLLATHKDIGTPFKNKTFGSCSKLNNNACSSSVIQWDGYYEKERYYPPGGYVLTTDSKATCPIGGPKCIEIIKSGQTGQPSSKNMEKADSDLQVQVNPLLNMKEMAKTGPYENLNAR